MSALTRRTALGGLSGLAAVAAAGGAFASADKSVELKKVFPYLDAYLKLPPGERNLFTLAYTFRVDGKVAPGLKATLVDGERRTPFAFLADGRPQRLPTAAELRAGRLVFDLPESTKVGVNMSLRPTAAPAAEMDAAVLAAAAAQATRGARKAAGLAAVAVPKFERVSFQGVGGGEAVHADGRRTPLPVANGAPFFEPTSLKTAERLVFAKAPAAMVLGPKE